MVLVTSPNGDGIPRLLVVTLTAEIIKSWLSLMSEVASRPGVRELTCDFVGARLIDYTSWELRRFLMEVDRKEDFLRVRPDKREEFDAFMATEHCGYDGEAFSAAITGTRVRIVGSFDGEELYSDRLTRPRLEELLNSDRPEAPGA